MSKSRRAAVAALSCVACAAQAEFPFAFPLQPALYLETGWGRDSHVMAGAAAPGTLPPGFGVLDPLEGAGERDAWLAFVGGGFLVARPVAPGAQLFAQGVFQRRYHFEALAREHALATYAATVGGAMSRGNDEVRLAARLGALRTGTHLFRSQVGLAANWRRTTGPGEAVSAGIEWARLSHRGRNDALDADHAGFHAGYERALPGAWMPRLALEGFAARQEGRGRGAVPRSAGAGALFAASPATGWHTEAGFRAQQARHGDARRDRYAAWNAGLAYRFSPRLTARLEAEVARNRSTAGAFAFERNTALLALRWDIPGL